jgi:hypothetical protein
MSPASGAELVADLFGFASGLVLIWPAIRDSRLRRLYGLLRESRVQGRGGLDEVRAAAHDFMKDEIERLRPGDYTLVLIGLALLVLSYAIKLASWWLPDHCPA